MSEEIPTPNSPHYLRRCGSFGLGYATGVELDESRETLYVSGPDLIVVYDAATGEQKTRLQLEGEALDLRLSPDGKLLALRLRTHPEGRMSDSIEIRSAESGELERSFSTAVWFEFSDDSTHLLMGDTEKVRLVDLATGDDEWELEVETWGYAQSVAPVRGSSAFVFQTESGPIRLTTNPPSLSALEGPARGAAGAGDVPIAADPSGRWALREGGVDRISVKDGEQTWRIQAWPDEEITALAFSNDGARLAVVSSRPPRSVTTLDVEQRITEGHGALVTKFSDRVQVDQPIFNHRGELFTLSAAGAQRLSLPREGRLELEREYSWGHARDGLWSVAVSRDGRYFATAASDELIVWNRDETVRSSCPLATPASAMIFSNDARSLWLETEDRLLELDPADASIRRESEPIAQGGVLNLSLSADESLLAVAGGREIAVLDTSTLETQLRIRRELFFTRGVRFSGDGKLLVGSSTKRDLTIWSVADGAVVDSILFEEDVEDIELFDEGRRLLAVIGSSLHFFDFPSFSRRGEKDTSRFLSLGDDRHVLFYESGAVIWDMATMRAVSKGAFDSSGVPQIVPPTERGLAFLKVTGSGLRLYCSEVDGTPLLLEP